MSGELHRAIEKFEERKNAMGMFADGREITDTDDEGARMLFSGLDLDFEETRTLRIAMIEAAFDGIEADVKSGVDANVSLGSALAGLFIEGLVIGMLTEKGCHEG